MVPALGRVSKTAFAGHLVARGDLLALPEVGFGLVPGAGGTVSIPRRIGRHRAALLGLSGQRIDAALALEWGLVDELVAPATQVSVSWKDALTTRRSSLPVSL